MERREIDWNNLGFGKIFGSTKYERRYTREGQVIAEGLVPYDKISLDPACGILNYGEGLIGGLRAYRNSEGEIVIFRLHDHAKRMAEHAQFYDMPFDTEIFIQAVVQVVLANHDFIPPYDERGRRYLYIRPQLFGSGVNFTTGPSPEFMFSVIVTPCEEFINSPFTVIAYPLPPRADALRKTICNYSPYNPYVRQARAQGFRQILNLDPEGYPEEVGPANVFFVLKDGLLITPGLKRGTILPGLTRDCVLKLCELLDIRIIAWDQLVNQLLPEVAEAFATGTAMGITPIDEIFAPLPTNWKLGRVDLDYRTYTEPDGTTKPRWLLTSGQPDSMSNRLKRVLTEQQYSPRPLVKEWNYIVE